MTEPTLEELWAIGQEILGNKFFEEKGYPTPKEKESPLSGNGAPNFLEEVQNDLAER